MKIALFVLLLVFVYLLVRLLILGARVRRGAKDAFSAYWEMRDRPPSWHGPIRPGAREKDISDRVRVVEERPLPPEPSSR